jgi:hypothetical protein
MYRCKDVLVVKGRIDSLESEHKGRSKAYGHEQERITISNNGTALCTHREQGPTATHDEHRVPAPRSNRTVE